MLTQSQIARLTALQRYGTKYEAIVEQEGLAGHERKLLGYSARRSRSGLLALMQAHGQQLIDVLGIGQTDTIEFLKPATKGAVCKDIATKPYAWIRFSGRTQRDAITNGELPHISEGWAS